MKIVHLTEYHPYGSPCFNNKVRNESFFHKDSQYILDFKGGLPHAIMYFTELLTANFQNEWNGCCCIEVPSHDPKNTAGSMHQVIKKICDSFNLRDYSGGLLRHKEIAKLSQGGNRNVSEHLHSIRTCPDKDFNDKNFLLLDDVTTTGNSLIACYNILKKNGANKVFPVAFAKTFRCPDCPNLDNCPVKPPF